MTVEDPALASYERGLVGPHRKRLSRHENICAEDSTWMDKERENLNVYEYLCHVGEAKDWIESCIQERLPEITALEEQLRNGVILAKLTRFFSPVSVTNRIFDIECEKPLQWKHSDNINYFFNGIRSIGLPKACHFELPDLYDKKNMPRVIYCIHLLSHFLRKRGIGPPMKNLLGKFHFTSQELHDAQRHLEGLTLPSFISAETVLNREMSAPVGDLASNPLAKLDSTPTKKLLTKLQRSESMPTSMPVAELIPQEPVVDLQAQCRRFLAFQRLQREAEAAFRIQAVWRGFTVRRYFGALVHDGDCSLMAIRNFFHLLDEGGEGELREQSHLEILKERVLGLLRSNAIDERELSDLDMKIGMLVRNRLSLDELVLSTRQYFKRMERAKEERAGLPHLTEEETFNLFRGTDMDSRRKLDSYEHLFHLLRYRPAYLARLFTLLSHTTAKAFVGSVVVAMFGYGHDDWDEFLLLKLLEHSIRAEIQQAETLNEFSTSDPLFVRIVLEYTRRAKTVQFARSLLQPTIQVAIEKCNDLDTNSVQIYRSLVRDYEMRTGSPSTLPTVSTAAEALRCVDVETILLKRMSLLRDIAVRFVERLEGFLEAMPYGIRFIARITYDSLHERFPKEPRERLLKEVGKIVYYRYIIQSLTNVEALLGRPVSREEFCGIAEISKLLQNMATGKQFGEEPPCWHLLNNFLSASNQRLVACTEFICDIPLLEDHFEMDAVAYATHMAQPTVVQLTPQEIVATHQTLLDVRGELLVLDELSMNDPLAIILEELGSVPDLPPAGGPVFSVALSLRDRFPELAAQDSDQLRTLFAQTKAGLLRVLRVQSGSTVRQMLRSPSSNAQNRVYNELNERSRLHGSNSSLNSLSLDQTKQKLLQDLSTLEEAGLVTRLNDHQALVNAIADDIRTKHRRRVQRARRLVRTQQLLEQLTERAEYLQQQKDAYRVYIDACVKNQKSQRTTPLGEGLRRRLGLLRGSSAGIVATKGSVFKYTVRQLMKMGVLVASKAEDPYLQDTALLLSSPAVGMFDVEAVYRGRGVDKVTLHLNDLLQKQFENVQMMTLWNFQVNVNLLLYLLNKKLLKN